MRSFTILTSAAMSRRTLLETIIIKPLERASHHIPPESSIGAHFCLFWLCVRALMRSISNKAKEYSLYIASGLSKPEVVETSGF
jgi:hypothetical protein